MTLYHPHPLLLPNIVSNILQHFDNPSKLESFRLVCHCWNEEACNFLRHIKEVKFTSSSRVTKYTDIFTISIENGSPFPHSKYKFDYYVSQQLPLDSTLKEFLKCFGEHVTSLHIPIRPNVFTEPQFLFDAILQHLPCILTMGLSISIVPYFNYTNLENYKFSKKPAMHLQRIQTLIVQVDGLEFSEDAAVALLSLLFRSATNLRSITFPGDIQRISKTGLFLRDVILDAEEGTLKKLCDWNFKTRLLEEDAVKLLCKEFPLRTLHIDLWNPDDDFGCISSELLAGLLRKYNKSLEHLVIEFPYRKEVSFHFHFPLTMENLTFLYLGGLEGPLLDLLRRLPVLRRLELSQLDLTSILPKPENSDVFETVIELRLDFCTRQSGGILSRFSRIFPQLQRLNINHTTNETARVIFQKMGSLIRLRMHGNDLTDAGMCGFSESTMKEQDMLMVTPTRGNGFRKYPFIADLKELQYLKLDAYALSEVTVRHGLVHCKSLRLVKIDSTADKNDSTTVSRIFKLSEYEKHLVEDCQQAVVEMKEEPPLDEEALEFFQSHEKNVSEELTNSQE